MKPNNFPTKPILNGTEELYTQTSGVSQKFTLESAKAFITEPTDITYSELYDKVTNGELIVGSWYRLTDYKSVNFLNGWEIANNNPTPTDPNFNPQEIYEGETEVLLLQAISSYEISPIGYSETFQGDIVQYQPYTNKIGVDIGGIYNGQTLPNSSVVSGFDLQWDGTNVYFNMPTGYPALYGHYFYLYCEFNDGGYSIGGTYEPLNLNGICQYPNNTSIMPRIKLENGGTKVVLLDFTEQDYLDYDANTLYVETVYPLGDAYGWITRRQDTQNKIDVPFDFRNIKYRRFEVDLSTINPSLGIGFYGIGDNFLGQGTTGNYKDFFSLNWKEYSISNLEVNGNGGADMYQFNGYNDNNIFGSIENTKIGNYCYNNTIINLFFNTIKTQFNNNIIKSSFGYNTIDDGFSYNTVGDNFFNNNIEKVFAYNTIVNNFVYNTTKYSIVSTDFTSATHVYADYNCEIFRRSDNTLQLSYIDGTNTIQYTAITA